MTYDEFESAAADFLGLAPDEAAMLAEQMVSDGYDLDRIPWDRESFWADAVQYEAVDMALSEYDEPEEYDYGYSLDPRFPDDDWLEAGVEWEMTAETDDSYMETA